MGDTNAIDLSNRIALVTGGGGGIGSGIAKVLQTCGAQVVLSGRSDMHAEAAKELGSGVLAIKGDVGNDNDCERMVEEVVSTCGGIDILVNNAASYPVSLDGDILAQNIDKWQQAMNVNLRGAFQLARAAGKHMIAKGRGSVINMSSISSLRSFAGDPAYTISKAGLNMLTMNLATHWGQHGVRVNCVVVGEIHAGMHLEFFEATERPPQIPLRRGGTPEEVGWVVAFLASDRASFVNGVLLPVDGGQMAH